MLSEVMDGYSLVREFRRVGYYETEQQQQLFKELKAAIVSGKLVAVTGVVGCGKTVTLRRLQEALAQEGKILVSKSLSVDKNRATLATLISALFYDLSADKKLKIPSQGEKRERELRELIGKRKKPVALFVDEAHDLHSGTLTGLKRLIEVVEDGGGVLSVVLAGHPKLKNDLRRPTMEEIGYRTAVFTLDGLIGSRREYIEWLLKGCLAEGTAWQDVITAEAIDQLATRLRTPLQIEQHLSLAFEEAYHTGEKPVTAAIIETILSKQLDDLEPTLTRHGYNAKSLAEQFNTKPAEIRLLFRGQLDVGAGSRFARANAGSRTTYLTSLPVANLPVLLFREQAMKPTASKQAQPENPFVGTWHIYEMELWDEDYFNMETQAYVEIGSNYLGEFQFGLVSGSLDGNVESSGERERFAFTWEGQDEMDPASGSGWLQLTREDEAEGLIKLHLGDRSTFKARKVS